MTPARSFYPSYAPRQSHSHHPNKIGASGGAAYAFDHKNGGGQRFRYTLSPHPGDRGKWSPGTRAKKDWIDGNQPGTRTKYQYPTIGAQPEVTFLKHEDGGHSHEHKNETRFSVHG